MNLTILLRDRLTAATNQQLRTKVGEGNVKVARSRRTGDGGVGFWGTVLTRGESL